MTNQPWLAIPGWATEAGILTHLIPPDQKVREHNWHFFDEGEFAEPQILTPTPVIAYSMGCLSAIEMASRGLTSKLILIAPFAAFCASHNKLQQKQRQMQVKAMQRGLKKDAVALLQSFYRSAELTISQVPSVLNSSNLYVGLDKLLHEDLRCRLSQIHCPTFIITAENDAIVSSEQANILIDTLAPDHILRLTDAGHGLPLSHRETCRKAIAEFLAEDSL